MTNRKSTKRALLMSVLSLLLCFSMLVGTTFAWFTDSVTSANNIIKSGELDVTLEYYDLVEKKWQDVEGASNILDGDLWEPGYVDVAYFRIKNAGSLALKYQLGVNIVSETAGKDEDGNSFLLSDYIYFDVVEGVDGETAPFADRTVAMKNATETTKISAGYAKVGELKTGDPYVYLAMVVYMPNTVGNEANHDGENIPEINLGINIMATQFTYEEDSFGKDYDENAPVLVWDGETTDESWYDATKSSFELTTPAQLAGLATLVNKGNSFSGKTITLGASMDLNNKTWTPIGTSSANFNGRFIGTGYTIYNLSVSGEKGVGLFGYAGNAAHIEGVHVVNATVTGINSVGTVLGYGYLAKDCLRNCTVENATVTANAGEKKEDGDKVGAVAGWTSNGNIVGNKAIDCKVFGCRDIGGIVGYVNAEDRNVTVSGNTVENVTLYVLNVEGYEDGKLGTNVASTVGRVGADNVTTVENNNGECEIVKEGVVLASSDAEMDAAIADGATTLVLSSGNYIIPDSAQGKKLTIVGNGETVVATQDDGSYEGCDYSLDGATVTFENIVINTDSSTYTGYARLNATYNNCVINGTYTLYGNSEFNNCTFNVSGDVYNIWTWGAPNATFNDCTFNSDGKAMLLYSTVNTNLTLNNCTFNDNGGLTDLKAAVEIGNDYGKSYTLIVNNAVVNGYEINDTGINTGTTLWGNKNSMGTDKLNVVVDGKDVY